MENLRSAIEQKTIGSEHSSFLNKLNIGDTILFNCSSEYWGMAKIDSSGFEDRERIWKDKPYPFRFRISQIVLFSRSFSFKEREMDVDLREHLGKGWAFKVVFSPNDLPTVVNKKIEELISGIQKIKDADAMRWLDEIVEQNNLKRRKRLGLDIN